MQPKFYTADTHQIAPDQIDKHAYYVIQKLKEKGFTAYLVGGGVRDLLLGKTPKDFDISTSAKPEEIKEIFRNCILIGKRFRLAHVRFGKKIIEVSTFRSGDTEDSALIVRDNDWGTEEQDVLRRDFTINGLFYDPETRTITDYVGGYPDIQKKLLRTIGQPQVRFRQDPVRMIRLLKFKARFDLNIDPDTLSALEACKEDIIRSSQARIFEELLRMLESGAAKPFFEHLFSFGLIPLLMPEFSNIENTKPIFSLLEQIDQEEELPRALLMSCLVFPIFDEKIRKSEDKLHLGIIHHKANHLIDQFFRPFFHIPRKMKGTMSFILTSQYRFLPLNPKSKKKIWIPKDPNFFHALQFFKVRCSLKPELKEIYEKWHEAATLVRPKRKRRKNARKKNPPKP